MKRILTIGGTVLAFSVTVLIALTSGASSGDVVVAKRVAPVLLTNPQKIALRNAAQTLFPGLAVADIDGVACGWELHPNTGQVMGYNCEAREEKTLTDREWVDLYQGGKIQKGGVAGNFKVHQAKVSDPSVLQTFLTAATGLNVELVASFQAWRFNESDKSQIKFEHFAIVVQTPTQFRAEAESGTNGQIIGRIE